MKYTRSIIKRAHALSIRGEARSFTPACHPRNLQAGICRKTVHFRRSFCRTADSGLLPAGMTRLPGHYPARSLAFLCLLAAFFIFTACQRQMGEHGRIKPLEGDPFFADGSSARPQVKGTVPREYVNNGSVFSTGREPGGGYAPRPPVPVDEGLLRAGQEQYGIYCAVCHGARGEGDGIVVRRGFTKPLSFLVPPLSGAAPGYFFAAMTDGFKTMDTYRDLVDEKNRWAITAYIKNRLQKE